jgi:hypothetical protein
MRFQETENDLRAHANSSPRAEVELQVLSKPLGCMFKNQSQPHKWAGKCFAIIEIRLEFLI